MGADDPFLGMGGYFSSRSLTGNHWCPCPNPDALQQEMDELIRLAGINTDFTERKAISDEMQLLAMRNYWKFPLYWEQEAVSFWPEVRGYFHHPQPSGSHTQWVNLWFDPAFKGTSGNAGQTSGVPGGI